MHAYHVSLLEARARSIDRSRERETERERAKMLALYLVHICIRHKYIIHSIKLIRISYVRHTSNLSYCKFWIYWVGVNTKFTNDNLSYCNFFYLHPPSKFEIYNTCITNEKSYDRRGSALWMSWGPNNCANFAAKVDLSRNWGQFHQAYLRLRYILRKDFFISSFLIRFTKSVVSFRSSFVTLRQVS